MRYRKSSTDLSGSDPDKQLDVDGDNFNPQKVDCLIFKATAVFYAKGL